MANAAGFSLVEARIWTRASEEAGFSLEEARQRQTLLATKFYEGWFAQEAVTDQHLAIRDETHLLMTECSGFAGLAKACETWVRRHNLPQSWIEQPWLF